MNFASRFPTEKVLLHKLNGEVIADIDALCQPTKIFVEGSSILIEDGDFFERTLPNGGKQFLRVTEPGFYRGTHGGISDHYQVEVVKATEVEMNNAIRANGQSSFADTIGVGYSEMPNKLFISHSSIDKDYIKALVELLEDIGMPEGSIVCTSVPGYGIPGGAKIYDWLRDQFLQCDLRVIFALSKNYYESPACLNEMGAAWVTKATDTLLLLPGFSFSDIKGCIDPREIGIKLDGEQGELNHRLNELKDTLLQEYSLPALSQAKWDRHRATFIDTVQKIAGQNRTGNTILNDSISSPKPQQAIDAAAGIMLVYAAETSGQIIYSETISSTSITAGNVAMNQTESPREIATWKDAIDQLLSNKYIELIGRRDKIYRLTRYGYTIAERFKSDNAIDVNKKPNEVLAEFES